MQHLAREWRIFNNMSLNPKDVFVGFVILHYITIEETVNCVSSIDKTCKGYNYHIVVVDNGSPNNSGKQLENLYSGIDNVSVIALETNEGFAKGNNAGYRFLKQNFNCDFIILSNNDIEIIDNDFILKIVDYYNRYDYAVLGPNIQNFGISSGKCNPMRCKPQTLIEIKKGIRKLSIQYLLTVVGFYNRIHMIKAKTIGLKRFNDTGIDYSVIHENVQVHGCFMVFSKNYIGISEGLNEKTFLYCEENILYFETLIKQLKTITVPDILILHKEKVSTEASRKNTKDRELFVLKNKLLSHKVLYAVAEEYWNGKTDL